MQGKVVVREVASSGGRPHLGTTFDVNVYLFEAWWGLFRVGGSYVQATDILLPSSLTPAGERE